MAGKAKFMIRVFRYWSVAAFDTAYGVLGLNSASSAAGVAQEPRISAEEMWT